VSTVFLRVVGASDRASALRVAIHGAETGRSKARFEVDSAAFPGVPKSPFAYWVSPQVRQLFTKCESVESGSRVARRTNSVDDNSRYVRLYWEVAPHELGSVWHPWAKGGAHSAYYYDIDTVIAWDARRNTFPGFVGTESRPQARPASLQHFFRPGVTWPARSQKGLTLRAMPGGSIFAAKGPAIFVADDAPAELLTLLSIANSSVFRMLVDLQMAFGSFEVGVIQSTPLPTLTVKDAAILAEKARRAWSLKRSLDTNNETSHAFALPAVLLQSGASLAGRAAAWVDHTSRVADELERLRVEINDLCFDFYGIGEADRRACADAFGGAPIGGDLDDDEADDEDAHGVEPVGDPQGLASELVGWAVGTALGRFDVRLATGSRSRPLEPEPFDPLPSCSPGMLTGDNGLPLLHAPPRYPISFPLTGALVDETGHPQDLTAAVRAVFDVVFAARADELWIEASSLLDPKTQDLRSWLATGFFEHHLQRYSKSRRRAPIYWPLSTPSGRYTVWLYAHRLTSDSLLLVQNDLLAPKLALEERKLGGLTGESAHDRTERGRQQDFVDELRAMRDELARVAPLFRPTLDDGIVLVCAPLWRLFRHRPWQKELHSKWDELAEGKYDWAQIAMHLWPERVVPKCAEDRSLAIAHGLEDVFWVEDSAGKWQKRATPTKPIAALVAERTSVAVKAALKSLIEAPVSVTPPKRRRNA
jgi:hypothetical protein